jgi:DNA-binding transcriptional LysR family regulator
LGKLEDMEVFARVVATGSLSGAGRELGLSPAGVSKRLKRLEETLGARLLQRTTRQISLTETGQTYFERISPLLAGIEDAETFVSRRSDAVRGTLKVSAPTSFGRMHIAPHIKDFMRSYPDLSINLQLSDEFVDIVGEGFDLSIRIGELTDSSLVGRKLAPVRRVLCAAPSYIERHGEPASLAELAEHLCLPPHNNDTWKLEGPEGPVTYRPTGPLKTNSSEVIREAVIGGAGIALRSTWDVGHELDTGKLVQVLPSYEGTRNIGIYALYASRQFLPAKIRVFIDFLIELYEPMFGNSE